MTDQTRSLAARLGIPSMAGYGKTTAAVAIDTVGVGLLLPISLLYFTLTTDIGVARLGVALTLATAVSLPMGLLSGAFTDRLGPKTAMVTNNLFSAAGYLLYLVADGIATVFLAMLLVAVADRMYWSCWSSYVHRISAGRPFERWFAFLEALKAGAMGLGAVAASVVLAISAVTGAHVLVWLNVLSCVAAAALFLFQDMGGSATAGGDPPREDPELLQAVKGWRLVLKDRSLLLFALGQGLLSPIMLLPTVALPVHFVDNWMMPAWVASFVFALNCGLTALTQSPISYAVRNRSRVTAIGAAVALLVGCMLLLIVLPPGESPAVWVAVTAIGAALAVIDALYMPAVNALVAEAAPESARGRAVAVAQTAAGLGMLLFPAAAGLLLVTEPRVLWAGVSVLALLGLFCYMRGAATQPHRVRFPEGEPGAGPETESGAGPGSGAGPESGRGTGTGAAAEGKGVR
ncbi:MFS transporter [Streptomonospora sediminis]